MKTSPKILLSGGGTGGHIFPAVAIAQEFQKRYPDAEFLFIGAQDKMEMQKVPQAGFPIKGIWIAGINRSNIFANIWFPFQLVSSIWRCNKYLSGFQADLAIGTGGFASGPALWMASQKGVPIFLQEQNSYPGITNKALKNKAENIFVAYEGMEQYFPKPKIINAGNPIRASLFDQKINPKQAKEHLGLNPELLTILNIGGSLGSRTLNDAWQENAQNLDPNTVQLYWQTGSTEYDKVKNSPAAQLPNVQAVEFIEDMSWAYAAADIIVSRAGAIAISELCVAAKATVLVPLPFAAEDHQTKNAQSLLNQNAALMVKDSEMKDDFWPIIESLIQDECQRNKLSSHIKTLAKPHATQTIVDSIEEKLKES